MRCVTRHRPVCFATVTGTRRKARALPWTRWGRRPQTPIHKGSLGKRRRRGANWFSCLRRPGGSAPWTPDGVPPPAIALRGGSLLYLFPQTVDLTCCRAANANLGTAKMGSGAYGPSGSRAEPWPSLASTLGYHALG